MATLVADRIRDTTTTTGTGAVTVSGTPPSGYKTFSARLTAGDVFPGLIAHQTADEWEVGLYTYSSANTVTRTTVLSSTNADAAVSFSAGTKDVILTQNAWRGYQRTGLTVLPHTITANAPTLDLSQTWNAGGVTFTGIQLNVTDTASAAASELIDLQLGGTTRFNVLKSGISTHSPVWTDGAVNNGLTVAVTDTSSAAGSAVLNLSTTTHSGVFKWLKNGQLYIGESNFGNPGATAYGIDIGAEGNSPTYIRLGDTKTSSVGGIPYIQLDGARNDGNAHFYGRILLGVRRTDGTSIASGFHCGGVVFGGQFGSGATYTDANFLYASSIKGTASGTWSSAAAMPIDITFWSGQAGTVGRNSNNDFGTIRGRLDYLGNWRFTEGALGTGATNGFVYIPTCAGTPTGAPTAVTGGVPMVYDTTNNKFYIYNGGWKGGTVPGTFT